MCVISSPWAIHSFGWVHRANVRKKMHTYIDLSRVGQLLLVFNVPKIKCLTKSHHKDLLIEWFPSNLRALTVYFFIHSHKTADSYSWCWARVSKVQNVLLNKNHSQKNWFHSVSFNNFPVNVRRIVRLISIVVVIVIVIGSRRLLLFSFETVNMLHTPCNCPSDVRWSKWNWCLVKCLLLHLGPMYVTFWLHFVVNHVN